MKKAFELLFHRVTMLSFLILIQLYLLFSFLVEFNRFFSTFALFSSLISFVVALIIINSNNNQASKISWLVVMLVLPLVGGFLYLLYGKTHLSKSQQQRIKQLQQVYKDHLNVEPLVNQTFIEEYPHWQAMTSYLENQANASLHYLDDATYYSSGEDFFEDLLVEIKKAQSFIFMQYFILAKGEMWNEILEVLKQKAREGVVVRVLYDDVGSIFRLPANYHKKLRRFNIECHVFNPLTPIASIQHNHRDHRKLTVIDGKIGFVGGINIGDEYINRVNKYGHWKDTAAKIAGYSVDSLTKIFLTTWQYVTKNTQEDTKHFFNHAIAQQNKGYVQAFSDSPLDDEAVGENLFLSTLLQARKYVYMMTPYLIISQEMISACCIAAKSGVDVRIYMPGIPDKKTVFMVSQSNYKPLLEAGVKIFEYNPGFLHAKSMVADDEIALLGTINLDYRSLYLHFENAALFIGHPIVKDIKKDTLYVESQSKQVDMQFIQKASLTTKLAQVLLKIVTPLL